MGHAATCGFMRFVSTLSHQPGNQHFSQSEDKKVPKRLYYSR